MNSIKTYYVLLIVSIFSISLVKGQTTVITDANFENYLETHDANGTVVEVGDPSSMGDGINGNAMVLTDRVDEVTSLIVSDLEISSLDGIQDFVALQILISNGNNLSAIDVSSNLNLITLLCSSNQLTDINIDSNTNLEEIDFSKNQISTVNLTNNDLLKSVNFSNNRISNIDISQNTDLESLFCASNQITALDVSINTLLKTIDVSNNSISNLDLSTINTIICPDPQTEPVTACQGSSSINVSNNHLTSLIITNGFNDLVTSFTSEGNPDLFCIQVDTGFNPDTTWIKDDWTYYGDTACADIYTYVPDDNFEQALIDLGYDDVLDNLVLTDSIDDVITLDVSGLNIESLEGIEDFVGLQTLNCSGNSIKTIDISNNKALTNLNVSNNNIANLNLSDNTGLTLLNVSNNTLGNLDISANLSLLDLNCSSNAIQILDLSNHAALTDFNCEANDLLALNLRNGQNANLVNFDATNNPNLFCIETDTGAVPIGVNWAIGATANYAINCGTYVPDDNFEQALIDLGLDTAPLDNYVPTLNISGETNLDVSNYGIIDLTGIQDFGALQIFDCSDNTIIELDLSTNINLTSISCNNNALEFVDIRNGNNAAITVFDATNNPNLFCVNVDAAVIGNIPGGWIIDAITSYNEDCENNRYTPIPDDNFEQALIDLGIDNGVLDNQVLTANIEYITSLNVSRKNIESLEGIKAFSSLVELDCSNNFLNELDVSNMVNLENLFCGANFFITNNPTNVNGVLNTTGTINLTQLFCADNNLADLDISLNVNLEMLDCSNNKLTTLDISNNINLIEINCDNNELISFASYTIDNSTLSIINCNNNELTNLAVNGCLALTKLNCRSNGLNALDISSNTALEVLDFSANALANINLSANTNLISLSASQNQLTEIDDLPSIAVESLILDNNELVQLNTVLTGLTSLKYLDVSNNQLTDLDVTSNTSLIELKVSNNNITSPQLAANLNQLKTFNCNGNSITGDLDLTTMGTGACPAQNEDNPLDFCPQTITINVSDNQLEFVNLQNGINDEISGFSATNNPNLNCIQVDNVDAIGANWIKDEKTVYGLNCRFGETYVPDDNFEQALINLGYDVGVLDDYVPTATIDILTILDVSGSAIADLTGIEDFAALQILNCSSNDLEVLDLSENLNLVEINCSDNLIGALDLTNNTNISAINIANNSFAEFDASLIPALEVFDCSGNTIVELDLSFNMVLVNLNCASNILEVLNLQNGQNPMLLNLDAQNNSELSCIQTDNGASPSGVMWLKDTTTQYALDCHFGETYVPDDNFEQALIDLGYDILPLDDYVSTANIQNLQSLNIEGNEISDLTGIEDFEGLTNLSFENNEVVTVDLSNNVLLETLNASDNQLADIDISSLINLTSLNVASNSLTELNTDANLNLTNLNIADNQFEVLDVSLLSGLEMLNCSSNQLTELNFTMNTSLRELICSSNLLFQDKLNIQNGANQTLRIFNATNNPDLSCILVDNPTDVISNVDGLYENWFKDATANYQTICDDADNDGVANVDDLCPGTPLGEPVDLFGCTYSTLPEDNFTILITGETCLNNNDGKINITTNEFYEYQANLTGEDFNKDYTFTNEIDILNLLAGTYRLCITTDELPNFQRCFDVVINHPEHLEVITGKRKKGKEIVIQMSGSNKYIINFNGLVFNSYNSEITLQLENGENNIKVSTDKSCQGIYEERIFLSNETFVYPVPFQNQLNIYLGNLEDDNIEINIYSYLGQLMYSKAINSSEIKSLAIETANFNSGIYTVSVSSKMSTSTFKVVKR